MACQSATSCTAASCRDINDVVFWDVQGERQSSRNDVPGPVPASPSDRYPRARREDSEKWTRLPQDSSTDPRRMVKREEGGEQVLAGPGRVRQQEGAKWGPEQEAAEHDERRMKREMHPAGEGERRLLVDQSDTADRAKPRSVDLRQRPAPRDQSDHGPNSPQTRREYIDKGQSLRRDGPPTRPVGAREYSDHGQPSRRDSLPARPLVREHSERDRDNGQSCRDSPQTRPVARDYCEHGARSVPQSPETRERRYRAEQGQVPNLEGKHSSRSARDLASEAIGPGASLSRLGGRR